MQKVPNKILIIQTAFIGDAILSTSLVETWKSNYPHSTIDILVRKGNEALLENNSYLNNILIWDKKKNKYANLFKLIAKVRNADYDAVFNVQRFFATGLITAFSGAQIKVGYKSNPLSFLFSRSILFDTSNNLHETERNIKLLQPYCTGNSLPPKLYPSGKDNEACEQYKKTNYICLAPTSVWFTKQWPKENWVKLIKHLSSTSSIYLLGAPNDFEACEEIRKANNSPNVINLAGKLSFLESASLMRDATMNYVNDSAPMHIASSMNAPTTAIYCSTLPSFGFGPLSDDSKIIEYKEELTCRPCGLHGKKECPEGHFNCSDTIDLLIETKDNV